MITRSHPVALRPASVLPVLVAGAALFVGLCVLFWPFVADDAYIVGRYAMNAAEGLGLVYNAGERVSALTSPLHALLEATLALAGLDPVGAYRLLAPLLVLAGWVVAVRRCGLEGTRLVLFSALSLGSPFLALWTVGGLETGLLALFATLFVVRLVGLVRAGAAATQDFLALGLLAGLMFLTRHDSALVSLPVLLAIAAVEYRRLGLWLGGALAAALAAAWLGFAAYYYGDLFPTSYYLKFAYAGKALDSLSALLNFALLSGLLLLLPLVKLPRLGDRPLLARAILRGAAFSVMLFLIYASRASGQHMMFGYRLFVPYLPAAALVLVLAIAAPRAWLAGAVVALQGAMVAVVTFWGVNPAPLTRLPGLRAAYAEYEFVTPRTYGAFMAMLREDAEDIVQHWRETGQAGQPRIYLRTGGTGYWLRDFYVYETLVSFRHGCGVQLNGYINAAHYMQQLGFSQLGTVVEDRGRARDDIADDAPLMFATTLDWMGPEVTGYLYGPSPSQLDPGDRLAAPCAG